VTSSPPSTLLDATARRLPGRSWRASVHYYNSEDEVARSPTAIAELP